MADRPDASPVTAWVTLGASVRGSAHVRSGKPNQDAVDCAVSDAAAVIAVGDGHGGDRHPRSDAGARMAVSAALDALAGLDLGRVVSVGDVDVLFRSKVLPRIVHRWRELVEADAASAASGRPAEGDAVWELYGTTLLAAGAWGPWLVTLQLGDGDIGIVGAFEGCTDVPHPYRHTTVSTETESLCMPDAEARFLMSCRDLRERPIALVFAASDGFGGAIEDRDWHASVGGDLARHLSHGGPDEIERRLPGWLEGPADVAGDDTTMAIMCALR